MLDTTREIEIPEGVELSIAVAGLVSRSLAFMIDILIRWTVLGIISAFLGYLGYFGQGLFFILVFLVEWFYPVLFEVLNQGQTIGKKSLDIMVINDDGTPVDWSSSIVRNLLRFADFLPMLFGFGVLSMLINKDFKRLGDLAAGTIVVHKKNITKFSKKNKNEEKKDILDQDGLSPKTPLNLEEQSAIMNFAERSEKMSIARTHELAGILAPWLEQPNSDSSKDNSSENNALLLKRMAKWLRGH